MTPRIRGLTACLWLVLGGWGLPPGIGEEPATHYMGRLIARTMHWSGADWLVRTEREREESTEEMLSQLPIRPGAAVCDLGCGNGYHTLALAEQVGPTGIVYAVDIQTEMLDALQERAAAQGLDRIRTVLGSATNPHLPDAALDLVLMVDVYHEFSHPSEMLAAIRNSLKPDGALVLVEFRAEDDSVPIKPEHKMSKPQILKELTANGFLLVRDYNQLPWQHMLFFQADESTPLAVSSDSPR